MDESHSNSSCTSHSNHINNPWAPTIWWTGGIPSSQVVWWIYLLGFCLLVHIWLQFSHFWQLLGQSDTRHISMCLVQAWNLLSFNNMIAPWLSQLLYFSCDFATPSLKMPCLRLQDLFPFLLTSLTPIWWHMQRLFSPFRSLSFPSAPFTCFALWWLTHHPKGPESYHLHPQLSLLPLVSHPPFVCFSQLLVLN